MLRAHENMKSYRSPSTDTEIANCEQTSIHVGIQNGIIESLQANLTAKASKI